MRRRELIALIGCAALWPLARAQPAARKATSDSRDGVASSEWEIGPIINGRQYSVGMPTSPTPDGEGFWFDFQGTKGPRPLEHSRPTLHDEAHEPDQRQQDQAGLRDSG